MTRAIDLGLVNGQLIVTDNDIEEITQNANADIVSAVKAELDSCLEYDGYDDVVGLQVDYENKKFTRLAGAAGKEAGDDFDRFSMYGGMKRCNVDDSGNILAYYGDADFSDRGYGQVMVCIPKFYYKVVPLRLEKIDGDGIGYHIRKANYYISDKLYPGFKVHPAFINEDGKEIDYFLHSAYEGVVQFDEIDCNDHDESEVPDVIDNNAVKIQSISGIKPISGRKLNLTVDNAEKYCSNRGIGWHCQTIQALSALQFLMMIEYGSMNLQNCLGKGVVDTGVISSDPQNFAVYTGSTASLGNKSGLARSSTCVYYSSFRKRTVRNDYTENGKVSISYRGIENPYGNINKFIQGIYLKHYGSAKKSFDEIKVSSNFKYGDVNMIENPYEFIDLRVNHYDGYISAMGYGNEEYDWVFFPSETDGTSVLPVGDYDGSYATSSKVYAAVVAGGYYNNGDNAGAFCLDSTNYITGKLSGYGCRLIYLPQN